MAKARPIPGLSADDTYAAAAAKILAVRTQELADHSDGVQDLDAIERLHAMRVATRRLRAALEVFEPCFPGEEHEAVLAEIKALADILGERRDRDVTILALEEFAETLSAPDKRGVASLVETLRLEQAEVNDALTPVVASERVADLRQRLGALVARAERLDAATEPPVLDERTLARSSAENGSGGAA